MGDRSGVCGMQSAATHNTVDAGLALAGASYADDERASFGAVTQAVDALGADPGLVLIFPTGTVDPADAAGQAQAAAGDAHVVGMTGTGAITADGAITTGCSAIAFSRSLSVGVGVGTAIEPRARGREAAEGAFGVVDTERGYPVLLLFVDSDAGDQAEVVAGAYEIAGGRVPLAGGAAGGVVRAQIAGGRAFSSSVVAVAIVASAPVGVGMAHGCVPRGRPSIVTRSNGPTVLELDGRPAETVYLEKLGLAGVELSEADFDALAMNHPLAEPELRGNVEPHYVRTRAPGGGLVCATSIERNTAVDFCDQTPEAIVESAHSAVADALQQLPRPAAAAVVFDCAARTPRFGNGLEVPEIESLISAFGMPSPCLAGVYTRGEIGRARGAKGARNYGLVVVAFSADA
jgi:hypothetical protein